MPDQNESRYVLTYPEGGERVSIDLDAVTAENWIAAAKGELPLTAADRLDLADLDADVPSAMFGVRRVVVPDPPVDPSSSYIEFRDQVLDQLREARSDD